MSCLWPLLQAGPMACQRVIRPHGAKGTPPSHRISDCSLNFASDPACWGLGREAFASSPNELELQKKKKPQPQALNFVVLCLPESLAARDSPKCEGERREPEKHRHLVAGEFESGLGRGSQVCGEWLGSI